MEHSGRHDYHVSQRQLQYLTTKYRTRKQFIVSHQQFCLYGDCTPNFHLINLNVKSRNESPTVMVRVLILFF